MAASTAYEFQHQTRYSHLAFKAVAVELPEMADAILFNYVHDISRTTQAVHNILRQSRLGARIAMDAMKFFPR